MAASGGNIEWSTTAKPILTALYGPFFDKNDAIEIIQAIIKSESEFQNHDDIYDLFYTCFACLSAHFISINSNNLPVDQLGTACDAFRIILGQILKKLAEVGLRYDDTNNTANTAASNVSVKQLLLPIVGLCGIEGGGLPQSDLVILTSLLKSAKLPPHVNVTESQTTKSSVIPSPITSLASQTTSTDKQAPSTAQRRSDALLEQLTLPLRNPVSATIQSQPIPGVMSPGSKEGSESTKEGNVSQQTSADMKKWVSSTCSSLLMELRAGSVVLEVCSLLSCLQRYLNRWQNAKDSAIAPQFNSDVSLLQFLVNEVHVCRLALSLPCLEPFTPERITTLSDIATAWLLCCATAQASLHPKDEESEQQTATLVESALSLYNTVGELFKQSTRAGGYIYQNHLMIGAWVLVCGLHHALAGAGPPGPPRSPARVPSRPYNLTKMQQGLSVVWVALGGRCLAWMSALLSDARLEAMNTTTSTGTPAPLQILAHHKAHQRELRLASAAPLHQLLVALGVVCYRKATNLKRAVVQKQHQDADPHRSDSTVYFQDMILCSEDSETDDEDSEPLFGLWFESTLVAPDALDSGLTRAGATDNNDANDANTRPHQAIVPDKAEPYSYITLAMEVFNLLTEEIISEGSDRLGSSAMQLHDAHQALLAALAKDLDRETARTDTGTISSCFGVRLGSLYALFSAALVRYLHNLSGAPAFASLQPALHQQLVSSGSDRNNMTPLQVGPRVVKLLGGMVLCKPAADRENSILVMWHKIVHTLQECALQAQPSQDHDYEDLNVEHAQLLVYLFHSLTLMQKKSVLLMTSNAIIKVVETLGINDRKRSATLSPHQLMLATRLMLLLEYLMRHLYDAPQTLLQQIEWNLVIAPGLAQPTPDVNNINVKTANENGQIKSRIYCEVPYIEQAYRRLSQDETSMRPKFYALTNAEINNQENPKLDGLACNFVLGTPHKLKYPLLLDAILSLLNSACMCDNPSYSTNTTALAAAHYCFQAAWRLVVSMPPATPHMDKLQAGTAAELPAPLPLHALVWAPRADNKKVFNPWLKDALVKQGMYTQYADNLLAGVSASCDNIKYTAWLASETIKHLKQNITSNGLPSLFDVISCDAALVRLKVCLVDSVTASEAHQFMPDLLELLETILECCRLSASMELDSLMEPSNNPSDVAVSRVRLQVCGGAGASAGVAGGSTSPGSAPPALGTWLKAQLPANVAAAIDAYSNPPPFACTNLSIYENHIIPSESAVLALVASHCELMSGNSKYSIGTSLMMLAYSASKLLEVGSSKLADSPTLTKKTLDLIVPALTDGRLEFLSEPLAATLNALVTQGNRAEQLIHEHVLKTTYTALVEHLQPSTEKTLRHIVKYWEKILDRPVGRVAYENVFADNTGYALGKILLSAPNARSPYTERVIKLFIKIIVVSNCDTFEMNSPLCHSTCKFIAVADHQKLLNLLAHICSVPPASTNGNVGTTNESPTETELPTPTSSEPEANPASLALRNALRSVFRTDNDARNDNVNRNYQDLPVFDTPSPAPRAQSEVEQQSESCSWSDGSKESNAVAVPDGPTPTTDSTSDNAILLTLLCKHIVHHGGDKVSERMLLALISVCGDTCAPHLLRDMCRLADAHYGADHRHLFPAAIAWLSTCVDNLSNAEVLEKLEEGQIDASLTPQIESACVLLSYLADALHAIGTSQPHTWRSVSPTWESPSDLGFDFDYTDEQQDDDDTSADDSDEEAMLQFKLCTFTVTQREFMNQHWYHCHTCKMVDGVGVCTVCARVCHRSHDVSYAKFGNFFCDCGAKPDSSCQALVKRSLTLGGARNAAGGSEDAPPAPSIRRRPSSPTPPALLAPPRRPVLAHNIHCCRQFLLSYGGWSSCLERVRRLLGALTGPVRAACERGAAVGAHGRAQRALAQLHLGEKRFTNTDALMMPTLGSQEGAFENVRMSYTGENGQTIRQLMSAHKLRRVAMCCLASPHGRRQHLAVSHEKGKITVLQLSALLKQSDFSKHKLTLTRLSSAPIPFTVLSLSGNPCNEDLLAVCGLKECHVLTFNSGGAVADHLVLNTGLEANNYVIKAIWLPSSQTQLALVTSDFVKIFDLSKDLTNPMHHFLVPSGKVRDVTFVNQDEVMHMLCMSSAGHIYWQPMSEESRATLGTFYITNTLEVLHPEIQDVAGLVGGGGVSIYYSHTLRMLFFSYAQGKSFLAPLNSVEDSVKGTAMITLSSPAQKEGRKAGVQSLCQWAEVPAHPGLVTAVMQASNNPVVLMLTPNNIFVQEIKVVPAKAKITDMVAVRHWCGGGEQKSTLILLCEDGSLRMYAASNEHTVYWLSSAIQPVHAPRRRPRLLTHHKGKAQQTVTKSNSNGTPQFPIDFFEHCVAMSDIEFGGNDLLQVYNTAQIKHRLNTTGLYVVSTKMSGFTMEVNNSDPNMVICGIRVLLGSQDVARTPAYVEVYGRSIQTIVIRNRWFDIPLTREESLQADKKLLINFGPSQEPDGVTMVDSVKVYGKNKEQFGWPEENEDPSACSSSSKVAQETENNSGAWKPSSLERLACAALEALELGASAPASTGASAGAEAGTEAARRLLCAPASPHLHARAQCLLRAVYQTQYHQFKDQSILRYVCTSLRELRDTPDARNIDPEAYFRLVLLARGVTVARPQHLVKFSAPTPSKPTNGDWSTLWRGDSQGDTEREPHLCALLISVLWKLTACRNRTAGPPGILSYGLRHSEHTLHALADTIHAFQLHADTDCIDFGNQIYLSLLLAEDQIISFGTKAALMRVLRPRVKRRRVYIPSPPNTPGAGSSVTTAQPTSSITEAVVSESELSANRDDQQENQYMDVDDSLEPMVLLAPDGGLEALLDIPADADDETMVELAIALSLQEQGRRAPAAPAAPAAPPAPAVPASHPHPAYSDATASPNGSDDEGSTAATDGSTLRTSPAEAGGSAASDSGGSAADSIGGVSGRSSAYGEVSAPVPMPSVALEPAVMPAGPSSSSQPVASTSRTVEVENESRRLHTLRLSLLSAALDTLPTLRTLPGVRAIPFIQVVLMLAGDLDSSIEADRGVLDRLLEVLVFELDIQPEESANGEDRTERRELQLAIMRLELLVSELDAQTEEHSPPVHERTNRRELQLIIMRLLSVLMARWKSCSSSGGGASGGQVSREGSSASAAHVSRLAAAALVRAAAPQHCYNVLAALLPYWKEKTGSNAGTTTAVQQLLKPQPPLPLPDMQPFFVKEYVKGHALDVFDNYPQLVMEMALRLPCQIHKHCDPKHFDARWRTLLCEYMMNQQTPLRKQVRKLLLLLCGTRERYRQLRDVHALDTHLNAARALLATDPAYDKLVRLMEHLKACAEIVSARTGNWQHTCSTERRETLSWLVRVARRVHPHVAPTVLQLLQAALCAPASPTPGTPVGPPPAATIAAAAAAVVAVTANKAAPEWPDRERSTESDAFVSDGSKFQDQRVPQLVQQILKQVSQDELKLFVKAFLLETNSTAVRWQAHGLLLAIYNNCAQAEQSSMASLLWGLWPSLPQYGRKAAQFVDLLGYFTLKTPNIETEKYLGSAVELLSNQNQLLSSHGNASLYAALGAYVELDGYYLESEPCLVCNNPEVPMATIKLPTIKIDSKFTTTTQIVKLVNSHMISRISLRIGDIKRSKMVRTINFYYNNRTVQAVQELKNKPGMWHKAKRVQLQSGQSEVRVDFPLPIVACNLMMEYADFYENQQATGESLQCPRCSQSVPANPGVCANCGENVFQCHKCRAINYDEKDPFLCHACGFCKYAKFDYTLTARPCCAVDTIENDEERKKMVQTIGALLDKADRVYRQLIANKPVLESLVHKISEHRVEGRADENSNGASAAFGGAQINRVIQTLAHKYCVESKGHFEDLSKIIQKVLACRKELVAYDRSQSEQQKGDTLPVYAGLLQNYDGDVTKESGGGCYGCSVACAEQCLTLLRALASQRDHRATLCRFGLVHELVQHNLHRGTPQCQEEVRALICLVTRDNFPATEHLCNLLSQRITLSLMGHAASQDHNNSVRPLVLLLGSLVKVQDSIDCWEVRLRCIVKLWVWCCPQLMEVVGIPPAANALLKAEALAGIPGINTSSPNSHQFALQQVALPCLRYMQELMAPAPSPQPPPPAPPTEEQDKETPTILPSSTGNMVVDLSAWLAGRVPHAQWRRLVGAVEPPPSDTALPPRDLHLAHKYLGKWKERMLLSHGMRPLALDEGGWLRPVMFDPSSRIARDTACQMVKSLCDSYERTKAVLILLTSFLPEVGAVGEASEQFLQLYQSLASEAPWKQFLALRGVLQQIADLMTKEIDQLHRLEETTLTSDLAQGYALKRLTELLAMFLEEPGARSAYKCRLVGAVLGGYLSLRRLVVQRTRLTDDTQEKLLELLEEMTTGTETETAEFMAVCIETVQKYPLHDYRTPVFIFERLCSIIYPEENDVAEFFLTLEKDPQQEDFLQGRMLGNPYSSLEPGMGPLMRDVKNKICTDCELVALLEDDNGMELLVCNKIMSLDLPVKEVYKKVWCTSGEEVDAMRVVYRMRGLLGDATEEFVETLSQTNAETVDDEQVYRMANVLADCGGLEVMLQRLAAIGRVGCARALVSTLLRLLALCARVRRCVRVLTRPEARALPVLLHALSLAAADERDVQLAPLVYQLLEIIERILSVAASESLESFLQFSLTFGGPEHVQALLNCTECPGIRNNSVALGHLTRVLAALVYGNDLKMAMLVDHFKPVLDFDHLDSEQWSDEEFRIELFCVLCANIERNSIGGTLKDYLISLGVVRDALEYIVKHAPCVKPTLVLTDSDELKEFISRPALKYILRFLTGLAADHEPTQMLVCEKVIPIVHRLEQVSSGEHVGSLAENLLEALRSQPQCAAKVQQVREFTRQEKKRLAMAVRERQLGALGMRSNERGQVTAQCSLTQQVADLAEEAGAVCCICREGYKYQPTKVLGIYTFTKRCPVEEYEVRARKTLGYTTVSHYNIVHVECHMAAVRLARARDEWESAALQNASTRCNGLLPLWGPHVPEAAFASCLARHTTYLQECTGHRDIGHACTVHDLKLLLCRFARGRTFHDDTGGGGPLSNMQLVPALVHMALYVINTTRVAAREVASLEGSVSWAAPRALEAAHEADGPLYYLTLMLLLYPLTKWRSLRVDMLKRMLVTGHVRACAPGGPVTRALAHEQRARRPWTDYKPYAVFVALIQQLYTVMFKNVTATTVEQWPIKLAEYIRHNDEANAKAAERIVTTLTDELLPCASFAEFCDAAGFLDDIPDPDAFLQTLIEEQP